MAAAALAGAAGMAALVGMFGQGSEQTKDITNILNQSTITAVLKNITNAGSSNVATQEIDGFMDGCNYGEIHISQIARATTQNEVDIQNAINSADQIKEAITQSAIQSTNAINQALSFLNRPKSVINESDIKNIVDRNFEINNLIKALSENKLTQKVNLSCKGTTIKGLTASQIGDAFTSNVENITSEIKSKYFNDVNTVQEAKNENHLFGGNFGKIMLIIGIVFVLIMIGVFMFKMLGNGGGYQYMPVPMQWQPQPTTPRFSATEIEQMQRGS